MRTVYHAENIVDAHLVKDALENDGIPAFIAGEYLVGAVGELPARDFIAVMVPDSSMEAAERRVREVEAMLRAPHTAADDDPEAGDLPGAVLA